MVLVVFLLIAWLSVIVLMSLPHKLPLAANALTYMALSVVDINKVTFLGYKRALRQDEYKHPPLHFLNPVSRRDLLGWSC